MIALPNARLTLPIRGRGRSCPGIGGSPAYGVSRWPSDPIGLFTLTLKNVVVGSAIQIETQVGGSPLHNSVAATSDVTLQVNAYASGSPYNELRIKVRKGSSAPYFRPYETLVQAQVGGLPVYISQIQDD